MLPTVVKTPLSPLLRPVLAPEEPPESTGTFSRLPSWRKGPEMALGRAPELASIS